MKALSDIQIARRQDIAHYSESASLNSQFATSAAVLVCTRQKFLYMPEVYIVSKTQFPEVFHTRLSLKSATAGNSSSFVLDKLSPRTAYHMSRTFRGSVPKSICSGC